ncbi:hypothetical protein LSH36_1034g00020 [Paralvinella palmiformis]|uniref:Uncharacterized protein n=1 Tax=Paralvinella palmiformis TaxID=53620 RepID=A0AAD9IW90_9ANNE|nr:hypothetical protein LSH36_1034g00020 [Paralvinella palmiformis]
MDSVTSEYLINGNSSHLCSCLASLYAHMLEHNCAPTCFKAGVIIPIPKKATLDVSIFASTVLGLQQLINTFRNRA